MLVTLSWMEKNYDKYNNLFWNGELPNIEFKVSRSQNTWGYASYHFNLKKNEVIPLSITLSNYYDSPEDVKITTLLHEMIHIADYTFNPEHFVKNHKKVSKRIYDTHGYWFKSEAQRLAKFGWNIEKYVTEEEKIVSTLSATSKIAAERKKNDALVCAVIGSLNTWYFKTNISHSAEILRTIGRVDWKYNGIDLKDIKFYTVQDESLATKRSCGVKLRGRKISTSELDNIISKYGLEQTNEYNKQINKTLKKLVD